MADSKRESRGVDSEVGQISIEVKADVGEAITGFKTLQRELRKTTQEARELESAYRDLAKSMGEDTADSAGLVAESLEYLARASTKELHEELAKREGVREINISAGNAVFLRDGIGEIGRFEGPARILVNKD